MKKIYLIRHGQTDFNKSGIVQGKLVNASLNQTGIEQSHHFYSKYKMIPFDIVFTSTLKRSHESVHHFISQGLTSQQEAGLDEISWGDYDGKPLFSSDYYKNMINHWNNGETHLRPTNGESPDDVTERLIPVIEKIKNSEHKNVLICMHGRAIRILLCHLTNTPLKDMDLFPHHNLGLYEIEYTNNEFKLVQHNNIDHLPIHLKDH